MTAIDASVAIAVLDIADTHHDAAVTALADAVPPLVLHPITAAEVLVRPAGVGREAEAWDALLRMGFELDHHPVDPVQLARIRARTGMRLPDCCVVATADNHGTEILTFGERLHRAPRGDR